MALVGCVDAAGRFGEFDERVGTMVDANPADRPPSMIHDINGKFLLAADPIIVPGSDPSTFVQFLTTFALHANATSDSLDANMQP
ncbi:MAG: hypothetical protein ACRDH5_06415, partial [bacterium]